VVGTQAGLLEFRTEMAQGALYGGFWTHRIGAEFAVARYDALSLIDSNG
jgi:hypothetical protein